MAQRVKNLPAVQKTQIQTLGQEDSLEKEMAAHSNILAWRIPSILIPACASSSPALCILHKS